MRPRFAAGPFVENNAEPAPHGRREDEIGHRLPVATGGLGAGAEEDDPAIPGGVLLRQIEQVSGSRRIINVDGPATIKDRIVSEALQPQVPIRAK